MCRRRRCPHMGLQAGHMGLQAGHMGLRVRDRYTQGFFRHMLPASLGMHVPHATCHMSTPVPMPMPHAICICHMPYAICPMPYAICLCLCPRCSSWQRRAAGPTGTWRLAATSACAATRARPRRTASSTPACGWGTPTRRTRSSPSYRHRRRMGIAQCTAHSAQRTVHGAQCIVHPARRVWTAVVAAGPRRRRCMCSACIARGST